jgi:hypothetical protein
MIFKNNKTRINYLKYNKGNISILLLTLNFIFILLLICLFDFCQLFIAREYTKKASDAIALAAAQNLLFFEKPEIIQMANTISNQNNCEIDLIEFNYDEVIVTTVKKVNFIFISKFYKNKNLVYSTSKVKVTYPWDEKFKNCKFFKFEF